MSNQGLQVVADLDLFLALWRRNDGEGPFRGLAETEFVAVHVQSTIARQVRRQPLDRADGFGVFAVLLTTQHPDERVHPARLSFDEDGIAEDNRLVLAAHDHENWRIEDQEGGGAGNHRYVAEFFLCFAQDDTGQ